MRAPDNRAMSAVPCSCMSSLVVVIVMRCVSRDTIMDNPIPRKRVRQLTDVAAAWKKSGYLLRKPERPVTCTNGPNVWCRTVSNRDMRQREVLRERMIRRMFYHAMSMCDGDHWLIRRLSGIRR